MSTFSLLAPEQPQDVTSLHAVARLVDTHGLARLWLGQSFGLESHLAMASLGATDHPVPVGVGTALAVLRTPYDAALQARSLAALLGRPVTIAYGAADPDFVRSVRGRPFERPASHTAEYARLVRSLLDGRHTVGAFEGLRMDAQLPPFDHPPVEVGTGVLRPGMAARSRPVADAVVTWLAPPAYIHDVLVPELRDADGRGPRIVANVLCALDRPGRSAALMAQAGCGNHLSRDHYVDMLRRAGLDVHASDPVSGARELVRSGVLVTGDLDEVVARLHDAFDHGIDEVVVNVTPVALTYGMEAALADLADLAAALATTTEYANAA